MRLTYQNEMKRSLKLIVFLTMLLCTTTAWARPVDHATTRQSVSTEIKGDANNDGLITEADKTEIENFLMGKPSESFDDYNADLNCDEVVNVADIVEIVEIFKERKALMDFYKSTNGDNWTNNTNWGTEKPLREWYGIFEVDGHAYGLDLFNNNLSGVIPDEISNLSRLHYLQLSSNDITGSLPSSLGSIRPLESIVIDYAQLSGTIPKEICELPNLDNLRLQANKFSGEFPEQLTNIMDKVYNPINLDLTDNYFSGKIPEAIAKHPKFKDMWTTFLCQFGDIDVTGLVLPAPDFELLDIDGNTIKSSELYKNNKLTLLYNWEAWCGYSDAFNKKLIPAYNKFHEKGFEVVGVSVLCDMAMPCVDEETYRKYISDNAITWRNASQIPGENYIPILYACASPQTVLVNQDGIIISQSLGQGGESYEAIISRLEEFFGETIEYGYYTSTDYEKDGEVMTLQLASDGNGIDIVFVGEGFVDKDMETGGKYEQKMIEAMEQFFSVEPYTSMRSRFNVYAVKAVSPNAEFASDAIHAIDEDSEKAFEYAMKAVGDDPDRIMVGVVYNTTHALERSYCNMYFGDGSFVAFLMDGVSNVLNHEMGGHGLAQLLDEYVEDGNESLSLPEESKTELDEMWSFGAGANVDYRSDASEVKWSHFLNDPRYAGEVGIYEGAFLYGHGAYRPTVNSMMRYNDSPFNAPSREAIYQHVMDYSESNWTYDYETFVAFDAPIREALKQQSAVRRAGGRDIGARGRSGSRPPKIHKGTWRDELTKTRLPLR